VLVAVAVVLFVTFDGAEAKEVSGLRLGLALKIVRTGDQGMPVKMAV